VDVAAARVNLGRRECEVWRERAARDRKHVQKLARIRMQ
jgi:hypothetical protein